MISIGKLVFKCFFEEAGDFASVAPKKWKRQIQLLYGIYILLAISDIYPLITLNIQKNASCSENESYKLAG